VGVDGGIIDIDDRQFVPVQSRPQRRGGKRGDRGRVGEHELDPRIGVGRVDR
jgi:hypothetical protein